MSVIKCKMCGGTIDFTPGETVGVCDFCGTKQTLPKASDEVITNLFNRANNLRLKCEFDKAEQIYEKIVQQDDSEAEAHWGIILCKYGIEYVEDPKTFERVPTCHRTRFESIKTDADYEAAIDYADTLQQSIYEKEARTIDKLQKDILAIVKNEKPFDVFICYKETDDDGKRTIDSALANDIYYQLTQNGFKVFYAAITLEDKLGQEYEPYIFAALNSAKVMLAIGTKPEYFTSVWVKNEWSRFMNLMKTDKSKTLIPCYRDMDAYDLPEEFAHLQAQDMSKIGFIQDIIRGVEKVVGSESKGKTANEISSTSKAAEPKLDTLLKRGYISLEDGEWDKASGFFDQALNIDAECGEAYFGLYMAEKEFENTDAMETALATIDYGNDLISNKTLKRALKYSNDEINEHYEQLRNQVQEKIEQDRIRRKKMAGYLSPRLVAGTVGVKSDGTVLATGYDREQLRDISKWKDVVSISRCYYYVVGLKSDGTVVATGPKDQENPGSLKKVSKWKDIVEISNDYDLVVGRKSNGRVVATYDNYTEFDGTQWPINVSDWSNIIAIDVGYGYIVGLKSDGTVVATGLNDEGQCNVADWKDIVAIAAGSGENPLTMGLRADGTVVATGGDYDERCNVSHWKDIIAISCADHAVGLRSNGTVVATGSNNYGECNVSDWSDIDSLIARGDPDYAFTIGIRSNGTAVFTGGCYQADYGINLSDWHNLIAIDACCGIVVGLRSDGKVVAIGDNEKGACNVKRWNLFSNDDRGLEELLDEQDELLEQEPSTFENQKQLLLEEKESKKQSVHAKIAALQEEYEEKTRRMESTSVFKIKEKIEMREELKEIQDRISKAMDTADSIEREYDYKIAELMEE